MILLLLLLGSLGHPLRFVLSVQENLLFQTYTGGGTECLTAATSPYYFWDPWDPGILGILGSLLGMLGILGSFGSLGS